MHLNVCLLDGVLLYDEFQDLSSGEQSACFGDGATVSDSPFTISARAKRNSIGTAGDYRKTFTRGESNDLKVLSIYTVVIVRFGMTTVNELTP